MSSSWPHRFTFSQLTITLTSMGRTPQSEIVRPKTCSFQKDGLHEIYFFPKVHISIVNIYPVLLILTYTQNIFLDFHSNTLRRKPAPTKTPPPRDFPESHPDEKKSEGLVLQLHRHEADHWLLVFFSFKAVLFSYLANWLNFKLFGITHLVRI